MVVAALDRDKRRLIEPSFVDAKVKDSLSRFFYEQIHRHPVIIPVVMEVKGKHAEVSSRS